MSNPDKKWFVYTGVQQEGPLSLDEVRSRAASGCLIGAHLAWCEGMETWLKVDEIEILRSILYPPRPSVPMPPPIPQPQIQYPQQAFQPQPQQYQNPFLSQPQPAQPQTQQQQQPQPQHPRQQQHHFQPQHQQPQQHPSQQANPFLPQQPSPFQQHQPQPAQPVHHPRQPLAEQTRISPLTHDAQAPQNPFGSQMPAPTVFLSPQPAGPLAPSTPLVPTAPMAPAAPAAPVAPQGPVLPGASHALPANATSQPRQPPWAGLAQPAPVATRPEPTITGLLDNQLNQLRHDEAEPETDLTPHGLSTEDDDTNSLNMSAVDVVKEHDEVEAEGEAENKEEDLSALIYMKLDRLEEKTGLIDGRTLKKAEKEAAKAAKISKKATKSFEDQVVSEEVGRGRRWLMGAALLGLGGLIGTGLGYGYQWLAMNQHWFRGLPDMPGVRLDERVELQDVIGTSLGDAVRVAVAMTQVSGQAPSFWVTSNLPDGAIFDVFLHGDPDTLIGAQRFDAVLHVKLAEGAGRTDLARAPDGAIPPAGKYMVVVAEADPMSQPENVRAALQEVKKGGFRLPPWVPGDRRVTAVRTYTLLMGKPSATYEMELNEARRERARAYLDRFKTLGSFGDRLNGALGALRDSIAVAKTGNAQALADARKRWESLDQELRPKVDELERQAALVQSQDLLSLMPVLKQAWKAIAQAHSLTSGGPSAEGIEKSLSEGSTELIDLKARVDKAEVAAQLPLALIQEAPVVPSGPAAAPVPMAAPATEAKQ